MEVDQGRPDYGTYGMFIYPVCGPPSASAYSIFATILPGVLGVTKLDAHVGPALKGIAARRCADADGTATAGDMLMLPFANIMTGHLPPAARGGNVVRLAIIRPVATSVPRTGGWAASRAEEGADVTTGGGPRGARYALAPRPRWP